MNCMKLPWPWLAASGIGLAAALLSLAPFRAPSTDCLSDADMPSRVKCAEDIVRTGFETRDLGEMLSLFEREIVAKVPDCHGLAHELGENAYLKFRSDGLAALDGDAYFCGFGFWHGFIGAVIRQGDELVDVLRFCEAQKGGSRSSCYHGVGLGFLDDPPPAETWGDPLKMTEPGLRICATLPREVAGNCASGVFHPLIEMASNGKYGVRLDREHPLSICDIQPGSYRWHCFEQLAPKLPVLLGGSLASTYKVIDGIPDAPPENDLYLLAAGGWSDQPSLPSSTRMRECEKMGYRAADCINGVVQHIFIIENEKSAVAFCGQATEDPHKKTCHEALVAAFGQNYPPDKFEHACAAYGLRCAPP
jgi:hypothetical protein